MLVNTGTQCVIDHLIRSSLKYIISFIWHLAYFSLLHTNHPQQSIFTTLLSYPEPNILLFMVTTLLSYPEPPPRLLFMVTTLLSYPEPPPRLLFMVTTLLSYPEPPPILLFMVTTLLSYPEPPPILLFMVTTLHDRYRHISQWLVQKMLSQYNHVTFHIQQIWQKWHK